jgi:gliding motility-associated-like protein
MNYLNKLIFCFITIIICNVGQVFSHSVQVQWCVSCGGDLRIWLEHWHGTEDPNSTTMTISLTINGTTSTITSVPGGGVLGMTPSQLTGCSTPIAYAAGCPTEENTYNDWVYYDFTNLPTNVPLSFTIISGNTEFTEDCCSPCMYPLTVNFTLLPLVPVIFSMVESNYNGYNISCNGYNDGAVDLSVSSSVPGGYTYLWSNNATTEDITNLAIGTYSVDIAGISSCTTTSVTLNEPTPLLVLTSNFANDTCYRKVGSTEVIGSGAIMPYKYLWSNNNTNSSINNIEEGSYSVTITDANNCTISEQFYIETELLIPNTAKFNVAPDLNIHHLYRQMDNPIFFIDKSYNELNLITKWFWEFEDGFTSNEQDTRHSFAEIGDFNVTLTIEDLYGCVDTITKQVIIEEFLLYIPNSFTPQDDGINDVFLPKGIGIKHYELKIFSRWGEHFFTSDNLNIGWNGTTDRKDKIAQDGVYVYLINVTDVFGEKHTYNGQVTLMK